MYTYFLLVCWVRGKNLLYFDWVARSRLLCCRSVSKLAYYSLFRFCFFFFINVLAVTILLNSFLSPIRFLYTSHVWSVCQALDFRGYQEYGVGMCVFVCTLPSVEERTEGVFSVFEYLVENWNFNARMKSKIVSGKADARIRDFVLLWNWNEGDCAGFKIYVSPVGQMCQMWLQVRLWSLWKLIRCKSRETEGSKRWKVM